LDLKYNVTKHGVIGQAQLYLLGFELSNQEITMRIKFSIVCILVIFISFSCSSSIKIKTEYDKTTNFKNYHSFKFLEDESKESLRTVNVSIKRVIENAIAYELRSRGIIDSNNPDLLLYYQTMSRTKSNVAGYSDYYNKRYNMGLPTSTDQAYLYEYEEGKLIIDIIDAREDRLVWQGIARKALKNEEGDIENIINKAVEKLFNDFPVEIQYD
jgi:hypothetical protein